MALSCVNGAAVCENRHNIICSLIFSYNNYVFVNSVTTVSVIKFSNTKTTFNKYFKKIRTHLTTFHDDH